MDYRQSHLQKGSDYDENLAADPFSAYMTRLEGEILQQIFQARFDGRVPRYLDFACGTGRILSQFEEQADLSYGVDVSENMVEQARRKCAKTTFFLVDLTKEQLDIPAVDLITAFRFFGNAQDELRVNVLAALNRHLAPGGLLVINNHRNPGAIQAILNRLTGGTDTMDLTYWKLRRLLRGAGFRLERAYGIGWWLLRYGLNSPETLNSGVGRLLEPVSRLGIMAPICPDAVLVARKIEPPTA